MKNYHFFISPIVHESRLFKEAESLLNGKIFSSVSAFGIWETGLQEAEKHRSGLEIVRVKTAIKKLKAKYGPLRLGIIQKILSLFSLLQFGLSIIKFSAKNKPDYISCHNVYLLPFTAIASKRARCPFVYLPHELETERTGLSTWEKKFVFIIEKYYIKSAKAVVVVCDPIASFYQDKYQLEKVYTIPNAPIHPHPGKVFKKTNLFREDFNIPETHLIFLYQGAVVASRGINDLIAVFKRVPKDNHLIIMGYGDMAEEVMQLSTQFENIHYKNAVPMWDIIAWSSSADVGVFFDSNALTLSYRYAMPNKFFEYAIGGLYILVSDNFVEQSKVIKTEQLGKAIEADIKSLENFVNHITKEDIINVVNKNPNYRSTVGWQQYEYLYSEIYSKADSV